MAYTHIDPGREIEVSTRLYQSGDKARVAELVKLPRPELLELLSRYGVRECYYGHIHGPSGPMAYQGELNGTSFRLVSADWLMFRPLLVRNISI